MDEKLQEDWLDKRLREEVAYIDDDGFTARVMKQLPPKEFRRSFRAILLCCITLLASAITYAVSGGGKFLVTGIDRIAGLPPLWILFLVALCSVVLTLVAASAALTTARGERLG